MLHVWAHRQGERAAGYTELVPQHWSRRARYTGLTGFLCDAQWENEETCWHVWAHRQGERQLAKEGIPQLTAKPPLQSRCLPTVFQASCVCAVGERGDVLHLWAHR